MNLLPLEPNENPKDDPFMVCDIETMKWTKFLAIGLYDGIDYEVFHMPSPLHYPKRRRVHSRHKRPLRAFLSHLFSLGKNKITIYAHFGGLFDFAFILEEALQVPSLSVENLIPRGSGLLCFDVVEYDRKSGEELSRLHFTDSAALLPFSLKSLCENFKLTHNKLDWDHEKTDGVSQPLLDYLKIDCLALYEAIQKFRKWPLIEQAGAKSTMASQALQVLRLYLTEPIKSIQSAKDHREELCPDQFVRQSYVGGRTEVFRPFAPPGKTLYCADVNSLYPYIMWTTDMPNRVLEFTHDYDPNSHGFYEAEFEIPADMYIPPLGTIAKVGRAKKFIFPVGRVKGRWTTLEIEYARSLGCKLIKTGLGLKFSSAGKLFKSYIDDLYQIRKNSPRESVDNILAKLLMNSCYGRTGLQRTRSNLIVDDGSVGREEYAMLKLPRGYVKLMVDPTYLATTFSNVAIAAWVTAASRIHMHKIYMKHLNDIYYTDTDSLFITTPLEDSDELGELKIEYESDQGACFLLPKTYCVDGIKNKKFTKKVVMKGFDKKSAAALTLEDFKYALEGDLSRLKAEMPPKFSTFKTAIRKGKIVTMRDGYLRRIISQYDKRKIFKTRTGEYESTPLHLS